MSSNSYMYNRLFLNFEKKTFYGVSYFWIVQRNYWEITLKFISTHSFYYRVISNWWQLKSQEQTQWSHNADIWEWLNGQRVTKSKIVSHLLIFCYHCRMIGLLRSTIWVGQIERRVTDDWRIDILSYNNRKHKFKILTFY